MVLQIAEKYGQSPEAVENWEEYWFNRAAVALEAESINEGRRAAEMKKNSRR